MLGPADDADRHGGHAVGDFLLLGLALTQADAGQGRVGEHAVGQGALAGRAFAAVQQRVAHHAVVVVGEVRELRAGVNVAQRVDAAHIGTQISIDENVAFVVSFNAREAQAQLVGVGRAARGYQ